METLKNKLISLRTLIKTGKVDENKALLLIEESIKLAEGEKKLQAENSRLIAQGRELEKWFPLITRIERDCKRFELDKGLDTKLYASRLVQGNTTMLELLKLIVNLRESPTYKERMHFILEEIYQRAKQALDGQEGVNAE